MFTTVDTHTAGEPTRTVIGGLPYIPGKTIIEKMLYLKEEEDCIRKTLVHEPRGNEVMSGVILTEPCTPGADIGVIFIEVGGYLPMCGHDTIGVATTLIETGIVKPVEPYTNIVLDTPAGLVKAKVKVENNVAKEVTFTNVPAFVFAKDVHLDIPGLGTIISDICYGGNFFVIAEGQDLGIDVTKKNVPKIIEIGQLLIKAANQKIKVFHPEKPFIDTITHVVISAPPTHSEANLKNVAIIPPGAVDRSPCGTGTSAKMASLNAKGLLDFGEHFTHESIISTVFKCQLLGETKVGDFQAVVPEITGSAYITGMNTLVLDPEDPFQEGFQLG